MTETTNSKQANSPALVEAEITTSNGLARTLKVEASLQQVSLAFELEYRKLQKETTLKGFRKGKAPLNRIRSIYGDQVKADVADSLFNQSYRNALEKLELNVVGPPKVTEMLLEESRPFTFTAEVEVFPQIEHVDLDGLTYVERSTEVTENDVMRVIESLRRRNSPLTDVTRPAEATDLVTADMEKLEDKGNVIKGDSFPDSQIDLSNEMTVKEFREGLLGASIGDEKTIAVSYPKDYPDSPFAGQSLKYKITVKKIQQRDLPELDDEFAKGQAGAESMDALRERIKTGITQEQETDMMREQNNQLVSQILAKNPVEAPASLVERYVEDMLKEFRQKYPEESAREEEMRTQYQQMGANQLRWKLLSDRILEQEKIEVLPEDTEKWVEEFSSRNGMPKEKATEALIQSGKVAEIHGAIQEEKLFNYLKEKAKAKKS